MPETSGQIPRFKVADLRWFSRSNHSDLAEATRVGIVVVLAIFEEAGTSIALVWMVDAGPSCNCATVFPTTEAHLHPVQPAEVEAFMHRVREAVLYYDG
jgi:hypothetical protein